MNAEGEDWSLKSFEFPLTDLRWGPRRPITDVVVIQLRVYTIEEKACIDACEAKHSEISHSPLNQILYGNPYYKGFFPACLEPIRHLQGDVEKRVLGKDRGFIVDEGNLEQVQNIMLYLKTNNMIKDREKNVVDQWVKTPLIEHRPPAKILSDLVLTAKLYDSSAEYKDWIAVSKSIKFMKFVCFYQFIILPWEFTITALTRHARELKALYLLHKQIT